MKIQNQHSGLQADYMKEVLYSKLKDRWAPLWFGLRDVLSINDYFQDGLDIGFLDIFYDVIEEASDK